MYLITPQLLCYNGAVKGMLPGCQVSPMKAAVPAVAIDLEPILEITVTTERYYGYGRPMMGRAARTVGRTGGRPATAHWASEGRPMTARRGAPVQRPAASGSRRGPASRGGQPPRGGARPPRRSAPRGRGWRGIPARVRLAICAAVAVLVIFGVVKLIQVAATDRRERFLDNVYVNGVCLAGYTWDDGCALMAQVRDQRLNTTYTLTGAGQSFGFKPADCGAAMEYDSEMERAWNLGHVGDADTLRQTRENLKTVPAEFNSEISYDSKALDAFVDSLADALYVAPVDAEVVVTETKPVIQTASKTGLSLDKDQTRDNLMSLILTGQGDTELPVKEVEPTISSDDMEMKVIAKFTTDVSFRGGASRGNVRLALSYFNGYVVYPGDTADFNAIVGPRTEARGFLKAPEYDGNELKKGIGGGVCQASTTLYNAVIMADMTILERSRHNMTVSYVEPSQDAAVEYGTKNLVFRNDTEHAIYIYTNVSKEEATVTIYGTRPEYHYQLESVILHESKSERKRYENDMSGKRVYYITDPPVLKTKGHGSCESEGWLVAYDWDTKEEVSREQISHDTYVAGMNVYWRGVHDADGNVVDPDNPTEEADADA